MQTGLSCYFIGVQPRRRGLRPAPPVVPHQLTCRSLCDSETFDTSVQTGPRRAYLGFSSFGLPPAHVSSPHFDTAAQTRPRPGRHTLGPRRLVSVSSKLDADRWASLRPSRVVFVTQPSSVYIRVVWFSVTHILVTTRPKISPVGSQSLHRLASTREHHAVAPGPCRSSHQVLFRAARTPTPTNSFTACPIPTNKAPTPPPLTARSFQPRGSVDAAPIPGHRFSGPDPADLSKSRDSPAVAIAVPSLSPAPASSRYRPTVLSRAPTRPPPVSATNSHLSATPQTALSPPLASRLCLSVEPASLSNHGSSPPTPINSGSHTPADSAFPAADSWACASEPRGQPTTRYPRQLSLLRGCPRVSRPFRTRPADCRRGPGVSAKLAAPGFTRQTRVLSVHAKPASSPPQFRRNSRVHPAAPAEPRPVPPAETPDFRFQRLSITASIPPVGGIPFTLLAAFSLLPVRCVTCRWSLVDGVVIRGHGELSAY